MSAISITTASTTGARVPALKVTQRRVLRSELTKFWSLRSTVYTMATAVVLMIGLGALFSAVTASQYKMGPAGIDAVGTSLSGTIFAVVAFGVFAGTAFAASLVASFISFFLGQALLSSHHLNVAITAPGALRSVVGAALYVTVAGLIGVALGALFRNTAAAIATFAGVFFVLPLLADLLPASVSNHLAPYLPSNAGEVLWGGAPSLQHALSPWTGFALLCGYAVVLIGAAAWRLRRADA
jgi:ABC-2 type transport system permease protein